LSLAGLLKSDQQLKDSKEFQEALPKYNKVCAAAAPAIVVVQVADARLRAVSWFADRL
jgi:hypothetical protein